MALNTNLYLDDVDPDGELHDVDIEASWLWLERTMIEARRKGQNVSTSGACRRGNFGCIHPDFKGKSNDAMHAPLGQLFDIQTRFNFLQPPAPVTYIEFVLRNSSIFRSFLPPCMWFFSFSSQFSSACTVKMQTKTGLK